MLFNSLVFLLGFLPVVWGVQYFLCRTHNSRFNLYWLIASSLYFYAYWYFPHLALLLLSILVNYLLSIYIANESQRHRKIITGIGVAFNLLLIAYFKYGEFFINTLGDVFNLETNIPQVALPLAISFFTFQQITYLIDVYKKQIDIPNFFEYCLYISFFGQLIAGPIVRAKQLIPQIKDRWKHGIDTTYTTQGMMFISIGLFKKCIIADTLSPLVPEIFSKADWGAHISAYSAWSAVFGYTLQLYFDFSGYSDIAIGLGCLCGILLPINFNSPYKAKNISDFWRRWHITLSDLLRDYLYIPLGGNRLGLLRALVNLMITMLIGGLWHGAGWLFVLWGGYHGILLCINLLWKRTGIQFPNVFKPLSQMGLFIAISLGWIIFRSASWDAALRLARSLVNWQSNNTIPLTYNLWIGFWLLVVWFAPNSQTIIRERCLPAIQSSKKNALYIGVITASLTIVSIAALSILHEQEFLYFQF